MVVLILFISLLLPGASAEAARVDELPRSVLFNAGDPSESVGALDGNLLEINGLYENYRVIGFEPDALILQDQDLLEAVKLPVTEPFKGEALTEARHVFVVRQLRAIFSAEQKYLAKYRTAFASDLATLIQEELLTDGFQEGFCKQDYCYRVVESGKGFKGEPWFFAVAEPSRKIRPDQFFSVDALGLVRYADTRDQAAWGPVWDYASRQKPQSEYIGVDEPL